MKGIKLICVLAGILGITSCIKDQDDDWGSQTFTFEFNTGTHGWAGDFADYPKIDSVFYELEFAHSALPTPLNSNIKALKLSGNNHSDDLFMFLKRKITGLRPNTAYKLMFDLKFASNAPTTAIGVGGSPGESVVMKVGATQVEPKKVEEDGFYLMNIDKANQSASGKDMKAIGHVGVSDTTTVFTLIERNNHATPFEVTTDKDGTIWVIIGTESGFEATTTLYYSRIEIVCKKLES